MVNITSLPHETQKMILGHLDPNVRSSHKRDLYHCTQVCKLWYDIGVRILHQRFWFYVASPPAPEDVIRQYFTVPHISYLRELHVLVSAGGHIYTTREQCTE